MSLPWGYEQKSLKAHNPRVGKTESRKTFDLKRRFDLEIEFLGVRQVMSYRDLSESRFGFSGMRRTTKRLGIKRKKAGAMTAPAFSFTRG